MSQQEKTTTGRHTLDPDEHLDEGIRVGTENLSADGDGYMLTSEEEERVMDNASVPMRPAHSIAFNLSFPYSGPFAFSSTLSSKGIIAW